MTPIGSHKRGVFLTSEFDPWISVYSYEDLKALIAIKGCFR